MEKARTGKTKAIVYDLETTGLDRAADEILQIGIIDGDGCVLLDTYVRPTRHDSWPQAQDVNGISPEMVADAPTIGELMPRIQAIFDEAELFVGYNNVRFDDGFLRASGLDFGSGKDSFDVMVEYAAGRSWKKLEAAAKEIGYEWGPDGAHTAVEDCRATLALYEHLVSQGDAGDGGKSGEDFPTSGAQAMEQPSDVLVDAYGFFMGKGNGLLLVDAPTGSGKSYASNKFMARQIMKDGWDYEKDRRIIFLAVQKQYLPKADDLVGHLKNEGVDGKAANRIVSENVMFVGSNEEQLQGFFENRYEASKKAIEEAGELLSWMEGKAGGDLLHVVEALYDSYVEWKAVNEAAAKRDLTSIQSEVVEQMRKKKMEGMLLARTKLWKKLRGVLPEDERDALDLIRECSCLQWIGELFPTIYISEKRAVVMTLHKCKHGFSDPVNGHSCVFSMEGFENSLYIIDEFDATKKALLSIYCEDAAKCAADIIQLWKDLYHVLQTKDFPKALLRAGNGENEDLLGIIKKRAEALTEEYDLRYNFKTVEDVSGRELVMYQTKSWERLEDRPIYIETDKTAQMNWMLKRRSEGDPQESAPQEDVQLVKVMRYLAQHLNYIAPVIATMAKNYSICRKAELDSSEDEGKDGKDPKPEIVIQDENMVQTILDELGLGKGNPNNEFLFKTVTTLIPSMNKKTYHRNLFPLDYSIYAMGVKLLRLEDSFDHELRTICRLYSLMETPERFILDLCRKNMVIGLSATCTYDTCLENYSLGYLSTILGPSYHLFAESSFAKRFMDALEREQEGYKDVDINVELVRSSTTPQRDWEALYSQCGSPIELADRVLCSFDADDYAKRRYFEVAAAFDYFLSHDEVYSCLALTTPGPRRGRERSYSEDVLRTIFQPLVEAYNRRVGKACNVDDLVLFVPTAADLREKNKEGGEIKRRLSKGEKLFLATSYEAAGTGVNLNYDIPQSLEDSVRRFPGGGRDQWQKDFDMIFLGEKTHVIPSVDEDACDLETVKYVFKNAELSYCGELTRREQRKAIKLGITQGIKWGGYKDLPSVRVGVTKSVVQGLGRLCRSQAKSQTIHILASERLVSMMDLYAHEGKPTCPEYRALVEVARESGVGVPGKLPAGPYERRAIRTSNHHNSYIHSLVRRRDWDVENMAIWKEVRELVLRRPVIANPDELGWDEEGEHLLRDAEWLYIESEVPLRSCWYKTEKGTDMEVEEVRFEEGLAAEGFRVVSETEARLPQLLRIPGVKEHFEEAGFCTSWETGDRILSPVLFQNVYKGALGEVVGKLIFENKIGIALEDIAEPEKFEKFDYRSTDVKSPVYVDFKHWKGEVDGYDWSWVFEKMGEVGAKRAVVANVLADGSKEWACSEWKSGERRLLVVPYLWDEVGECFNNDALRRIDKFCPKADEGGLNV